MLLSIHGIKEECFHELKMMTDDQVIDHEIIRMAAQDLPYRLWDVIIEPVDPERFEVKITYDSDDLYVTIKTLSYETTWSCPRICFTSLQFT